MKKPLLVVMTFLTLAVCALDTPADPPSGQNQPVIVKDWILVRAITLSSHKGSYDVTSWLPHVKLFQGTPPSGAHYYVEFMQPTGAPWVKLDCSSNGGEQDCKAPDESDQKSVTAVGVFPFAIKMRNELAGTDVTLFNGKAKVEKAPVNERGLGKPTQVAYFVNHDWALPIGYVYKYGDRLAVSFWVRGENTNDVYAHVFYKGKEVSAEGGLSCGTTELEAEPSNTPASSHPHKGRWERVQCDIPGVWVGKDATDPHSLSQNPGDYEVKVLWNKKLARSIKFAVGSDGDFADNGVAKSNKFVTGRVIVPVTILGDQDGQWDKTAWKNDAFYGNPLTGFSPPQ